MFHLDTRLPGSAAPPAAFLASALEQAARDAGGVPGAYSTAPWGFEQATPEAAGLLEQHSGRVGTWILVTCMRGDAVGHTRERCYTAVQRYLLSLAAEGVEATWTGDDLPRGLAGVAGVASGATLIGVVRIHPD